MAALDFGMALARGLLPKSSSAQKDLLDLAGGRSVFKSEDWWNKQVDKQISKGPRKEVAALEYRTKSGDYKLGVEKKIPQRGGRTMFTYEPPADAERIGAGKGQRYITRPTTQLVEDRKYFTAGELKDIEESAKAGAQRAKRQSAEMAGSKRRLARATGGLMGKARTPGEAPTTGLPALGEGGLGIIESILGGGIKV